MVTYEIFLKTVLENSNSAVMRNQITGLFK